MKLLKFPRSHTDGITMSMRRVLVGVLVAGLVGCGGSAVSSPTTTEELPPPVPPHCAYRILRTTPDYFVMLTRTTRVDNQYISRITNPGHLVGVVSTVDPRFICMLVPERLVKI